jgi:hypothetical protein
MARGKGATPAFQHEFMFYTALATFYSEDMSSSLLRVFVVEQFVKATKDSLKSLVCFDAFGYYYPPFEWQNSRPLYMASMLLAQKKVKLDEPPPGNVNPENMNY